MLELKPIKYTNEILTLKDTRFQKALGEISNELVSAAKKHPLWPLDEVHVVAIIVEECGEAMKEAVELVWGRETSTEKLRSELVQTAAMAIRALMELKE